MRWQVQTAKAKFSELLRAAREKGPQVITVRGQEEFVLITKEAFDRDKTPKHQRTWDELFSSVQGLGDGLELPERVAEPGHEIDFG
jgi:prevent-host-death family protein